MRNIINRLKRTETRMPDPLHRKLDNVALAFPAASGKKDSRVFRIYCKLNETVDGSLLQRALEAAVQVYPTFHSTLRRGNFWYYFEKSTKKPYVTEERSVPCSPIYIDADSGDVLYRVTYRDKRINLEIFHALSDGTGAAQFLREIVVQYLKLAHGIGTEDTGENGTENLRHQEMAAQAEDSFFRFYSGEKQERQYRKSRPAYQIRGFRVRQEQMRILECTLSVRQLLEKARERGVSITEYMTAVLIEAIAVSDPRSFPGLAAHRRTGLVHHAPERDQTAKPAAKPVTIMIPINLRNYYPSRSMANFFGWMEIEYSFGARDSFSEVLAHVKKRFSEDLERGQVAARMNRYIRIEKNPLLRFIPLKIKDVFLKLGTWFGSRNVTAVFSNMGVVRLPEAYVPYIDQFGAIASTDKLQILSCSWGDRFYFSLTSKYLKTDIQKHILAILKREGLRVTLETG